MTTDTDDEGFTTVHQSAAFAGAGAGGVVRPDLPITLSAAQAEIVALRGRVAALEEAASRLGLRSLVAGWNGENRSDGLRYGPHPSNTRVNLKTTCGVVYALDAALTNGGDNG